MCIAISTEGGDVPVRQQPIALTIVWDISPPIKDLWTDMTTLSNQAISSLQPDDYLEIITGHHSGPGRLRIAQFMKAADTEEVKAIGAILANIRPAALLDSDMAEALEMAYNRS